MRLTPEGKAKLTPESFFSLEVHVLYMVKRKLKLDRMNLLVPSPSHSIFLLTENKTYRVTGITIPGVSAFVS